MKRFIRTSKYLDESDTTLLFDDTIFINIELRRSDFAISRIAASSSRSYSKFPGVEQFRQDVLDILENEYGFDVIEDVYRGKLQKGKISNRKDSVSIYFDTYFDLANAAEPIKRLGITSLVLPDPSSYRIACFIHIRFSDHELADLGDRAHRKFVKDNAEKYKKRHNDISLTIEEENITILPEKMQLRYNEAIQELKDDLDFRIASWVKKAKYYIQV